MDKFAETIITDTNARYLGIAVDILMDQAGKGIAEILFAKYGKSNTYAFVCGVGNNAGDGLASAFYLASKDVENITVYLCTKPSELKTDATRLFWDKLKNLKNIHLKSDSFSKDITKHDVSIECLVGTGIAGKLHKRYNDIIIRLQKQHTKIVAIDVPASNYKYDLSISLMYPKTDDAHVIDLNLPKEITTQTGPGEVKILDVPKQNSHKSQNGQLLVIGGSRQFHGAPLMSIKAASKLVGNVFYYTNPENREVANNLKLELDEFILVDDANLEKYAGFADALLIGPGLEDNLPSRAIVKELLKSYPDKPCVLDAYAINIARQTDLLENKILTPHRGELRHIFSTEDQKNPPKNLEGRLKRFAVENKCHILLKGHIDTLFSKDGEMVFNHTGNQGMAKGGTGDILAGIIASLVCKNDAWLSMKAGAFICGKAGDNLVEKFGFNYSATDLIPEIQKVIKWAKEL